MKKRNTLLLALLLAFFSFTYAEDGSRLWLRFDGSAQSSITKSANATGETAAIAFAELQQNWTGSSVHLELNESLTNLKDGYKIKNAGSQITVSAAQEAGLLYGAYHLLRLQQTNADITNLDIEEKPLYNYRMLNHWDNLSGTIERGYAGRSIWKWSDLPGKISERYETYARANASIGINGVVLNNVNSTSEIFKTEYLNKIKALADEFRPYGIKVYLSLYFTTPMKLGGLSTADPLDQDVINWWTSKINEIYTLIPDFGGFLVKANSEGQPGPQDYGRTHADGANMLAKILKPHDGIVVWRAFVYGNQSAERSTQAYLEFKPLDGQFDDNVIIQIKNGPLDFQPREPFSALFGAMENTPLALEFQITQEYLGGANHLTYLAPMWKECLDSDTYQNGEGSTVLKKIEESSLIAGVANIGEDTNWCGHHFGQANWYSFGRLAWNPYLSSEEIAKEWIRQTFSNDETFVNSVSNIMLDSWNASVNFMTPFGLTFLASTSHHYGPLPWSRTSFHGATSGTIGLSRTTDQYNAPLAANLSNLSTCPEKLMLWFHPVSWDYKMKDGKTLWEALCYKYEEGVNQTAGFKESWESLKNYVDSERFDAVLTKLELQTEEAIWWKNACLLYFQSLHKKPFPADVSKAVYDLADLKNVSFPTNATFGCPTVEEVYSLVIAKKKKATNDVDYTHLIINNDFDLAPDPADCTKSIAVAADIDGWYDNAWRVSESTCKQFYGWKNNHPDFDFGNNAQGIDAAATSKSGNWACWFAGNCVLPEFYEFYQVIDKNDLPAGTYKLQCGMAVQHTKITNQRLFANNNVQYHGNATQYVSNLTQKEHNTFAGHSSGDKTLKDMVVYVTIGENDSLKIGIRTGGKLSNGSVAPTDSPMRGWFRTDNFRLTKLDPASAECIELTNANLASLSFDFGTLKPVFNPAVTEYTCTLPSGITTVTPSATVSSSMAEIISGLNAIDVSSGSGVSAITVKAGDGSTTATYTVNFETGNDTDYTSLIINNDFELAYDADCNPVTITANMNGWSSGAWRPTSTSCSLKQFYGWTHDQAALGTSTSQGINTDGAAKHGNWACWIGGNAGSDTQQADIEFYQTIDKSNLTAGTYKAQCLLAVGSTKKFNQRFFVNNNVQYFGSPADYQQNLVDDGSENYTFAGHTDYGETNLKEMAIYVTIGENESLKLGIRTSNKQSNGTMKIQQSPMFRTDYFRLTKINAADAADASLASITLSAGSLDFSPETTQYYVQLPEGTASVIPTVVPNIADVKIEGAGMVDVSSGSGVSNIKVTALDGTTTKTYTINYGTGSTTAIDEINPEAAWFVTGRKLVVRGVDAYTVYNMNGMKITDVKANGIETAVQLAPGIYVVKTISAKKFKVIIL